MLIRSKINRGFICHNEPIKTQFIKAIISSPKWSKYYCFNGIEGIRSESVTQRRSGSPTPWIQWEFLTPFQELPFCLRDLGRGGPSSPVLGPGVWVVVVPTRRDALWSAAVCGEANMVNSFQPGLKDFLLSSDLYVKFLEEGGPHKGPQAIGWHKSLVILLEKHHTMCQKILW